MRLPYGKRTGVPVVDRLNIVAHDKFQEIVNEANRSDSVVRLQQVILEPNETERRVSIVSEPNIAALLGQPTPFSAQSEASAAENKNDDMDSKEEGASQLAPAFKDPEEQKIASLAYEAIQSLESQPTLVPTTAALKAAEIQRLVKEKVEARYIPAQLALEGVSPKPNIEAIVAKATEIVIQHTIDIPRITVVPTGAVKTGIRPITLDLTSLNYPVPSEEMWVQSLQTGEREVIGLGDGNASESRLEDYVVAGLVDFNDISYYDHADLLYDLAKQVVSHFKTYLDDEETRRVLSVYQKKIAEYIHAQMDFWEAAAGGYEAKVSRGFTELKKSAYTAIDSQSALAYRHPPTDKSKMSSYLFSGFSKCLYTLQKFDSDSERMLAVILERDALKWFRPLRGQFQLYYHYQGKQPEYQPDFIAETEKGIYMLEPKMSTQMDDPEVIAKKAAAVEWCRNASDYMQRHEGKPWCYVLIPHDAIAQNMTLKGLATQFSVQSIREEMD